MADTSATRFASIAETAYGTTPATPAFQTKRITGERFKPNFQHTSSNELRADRNVSDLTLVGSEAAGGYDFELSYGSFDAELESVLQNTWNSNVLKNGSITKPFTHEIMFDTGATKQFHRYRGSLANSLSLNIQARQIVTGSFDFMCKDMTATQAIITGATYTGANSNPVINAATNFASLAMSGVASPAIMGIQLNVTNNLRSQAVVGQVGNKGIGSGRFSVTGSVNAYFENADLLDLYLNDMTSSLAFTLGGAVASKYQFLLPRIKFNDAEIVAGGNDQDVMANMSFQAIYDSTEACALKLTRTP